MNIRKNTATFSVIDQRGRPHIVNEFLVDPVKGKRGLVEYELAINHQRIIRIGETVFQIPDTELQLFVFRS